MIEYKWKKVTIPKNIEKVKCRYDRIRDFRMDPKGFFLIKINKRKGIIEAGFVDIKDFKMKKIFMGEKAIDIYNTIAKSGLISRLDHAADLGAELQKAEMALKCNLEYTQDEGLGLNGRK